MMFGLDEGKKPIELSEGMKVKFNLLLALSHQVQVLILDEPTSGLDPFSRDELLELFQTLKEHGVTILKDAAVYRHNALMNANLFYLGAALFVFGLFNVIFVGGFFRTAYKIGKPFIIYIIAAFPMIGVFEALHHFPGLAAVNGFMMRLTDAVNGGLR